MFSTVIVASTIVCALDKGGSGVKCNTSMIVASTGVIGDSHLNRTYVKYYNMFYLRYHIYVHFFGT